mgnify:FL=1
MKWNRTSLLWTVLACFFVSNALLAEFIGIKIFSLESSMGIPKASLKIGDSILNFDLTAGVIIWPLVFLLTDVINDYFGQRGVKVLSYLTIFVLLLAFLFINLVISAEPSEIWIDNFKGKVNINKAFNAIFSQGLWIILGSIVAFLVGQLVDAFVFNKIKRRTKSKMIWLRATISTLTSQFIDSYLVLFIAFYIGNDFELKWVLQIGTLNYIYKFLIAFALIPLLYAIHFSIEKFLGKAKSEDLKKTALNQ